MSSISVSSLVLGSLTMEVDGSDSTLALSVLSTAPASLTIELGTPGAQGDAATIAVGTTTTLAPGSSATVANVGTSSAAVFNFGIPAGQTGATGPGVPIGGTDGQVLAKIDATNYNTQWVTPFALQVRNQVRNETGAQLDKGTVVYVNGAAGNKVTVTKALATGDATSAQTFAVLLEDIPNNQNGYAVTSGLLENLDTSAYAAGTQLYLSPTVAGTYTSTKPSAPNHLVYVGVIERSHANQGTMLVRIQNGYELDELHDVAIASKTNNDLLAYESATNLWKNKSFGTLGLLTSATAASTYYLQTNPAGYIDATALAPYLTIASAAATYQTTAGMSAYLTTATAASTYLTQANAATTYYPLSGNPSGFITSSALTPYLTTATAASTYQTLAGMSSYLATANNLSELTATASTARTNLGLGTAAVEPATKLVPSGGTTGQVLSKASNTSWDLAWATAGGGGGGGVDIQTFGSSTTSGTFTWTKPANAKMVYVWMVGGGSGGGSGARRATTSIRGGGGGGGGGNAYATWINAAYLGATETVTVGTGVAGAPPVTVDNTNGTATASSTTVHSQFGGYRTYGNYGGGAGGTNTAGGNGSNTGNHIVDYGTIANVIAVTGLNGATTDNYNQGTSYHAGKTACGGGGGAGAPANVTVSAVGGFGAQIGAFSGLTGPGRTTAIAGGTRGNFMPVTLPGNGVNGGFSSSFNSFTAGTGGGGGAYITATAGQTGGNGGWPGGGGGGGSASDNGFNSGGGGNGANGIVVVITYS